MIDQLNQLDRKYQELLARHDALTKDHDELLLAVGLMRQWQRRYFRARPGTPDKTAALQESLAAERKVDGLVLLSKRPALL